MHKAVFFSHEGPKKQVFSRLCATGLCARFHGAFRLLSAKGRKGLCFFVQNAKNTRYSFLLLTKAQDMVYNSSTRE
jgi:hypothetical protein